MKKKKYKTIELSTDELYWIERSADLERANLLKNFNYIFKLHEINKNLCQKYVNEFIELNDFLLTLIAKLENVRNEGDESTEDKK